MRITLHARGWRSLLQRILRRTPEPGKSRPGTSPARSHADHAHAGLRLLLVDVTTPRPDRDSGSVRAFNLMRLLREQGHRVDFLPDDRADAGPYSDALRGIGVGLPCDHASPGSGWLCRHLADYDAVVVSRYHLGEPLVPLARACAPRTRIILDTVDLHFLREQREAQLRGDRRLERMARSTRRRELGVIAAADTTWVVSDAERDLLRDLAPGSSVHVLPNIIEDTDSQALPQGRHGLLFVGGIRHPPNVDAINWIVDDIVPRLEARLPGCVVHIAGEGTRELVDGRGGGRVIAHGHVGSLEPLLGACRAGIAPLRFGAGVKGKVNLYMSHGLPAIVTGCAAEGMHLRSGLDALFADDADAFADAAARIHADDALWQSLSDNGRASVQRHFSFAVAADVIAVSLATGR